MLYMAKQFNGSISIYSAGGLTSGELESVRQSGWTLYWTTDNNALADGYKLFGKVA